MIVFVPGILLVLQIIGDRMLTRGIGIALVFVGLVIFGPLAARPATAVLGAPLGPKPTKIERSSPPPSSPRMAAFSCRTTGACSNPTKSNGSACNDGDLCTQSDTCQAGSCVGASPVTCSALDDCHEAGTCDPTTGVCSNPTEPDGTACNNPGNLCLQTHQCVAGAMYPRCVRRQVNRSA